jgi:uncharacterized protein YkwD
VINRSIAIIALTLSIAAIASAPTSAPTSAPVDFFALSPDEFAKTSAAQQRLQWNRIDQKLLDAAILHETNRHRVENDVPPVEHLPQLAEAALIHANDMSERRYLSHEQKHNPERRMPLDRVRETGLQPGLVLENVATHFGVEYKSGHDVFMLRQWGREGMSYKANGEAIPPRTYLSFARSLLDAWMASPGHRETILTPGVKYMASACREEWPGPGHRRGEEEFHKFYCVQLFFSPRSPR